MPISSLKALCEFMRTLPTEFTGLYPFALDFETTGTDAHRGDTAFIFGICCPWANFSEYVNEETGPLFKELFQNEHVLLLAHNALFELSFLHVQFKVSRVNKVWDTLVFERMCLNNEFEYSLEACAKRAGIAGKYPPMLEWLKENKGQSYDKAPYEIIEPYVLRDAEISYGLYAIQRKKLVSLHEKGGISLNFLVNLEQETTQIIHQMHYWGIHVDRNYVENALVENKKELEEIRAKLDAFCGAPFVDSAKFLEPVFTLHGQKFLRTKKGNASFNKSSLTLSADFALSKLLVEYRDKEKLISTYWLNLLKYSDPLTGLLHPNIKQAGTATGRFSSIAPNMQNLSDDDEDNPSRFPVRRAIIADSGCKLVSMDYAAMELRMIADQAGETQLLHDLANNVDVHQRVATAAHTSRFYGKKARFVRLYGGGAGRLAESLFITLEEAKRIVAALDADTPVITQFSQHLRRMAKSGLIQNLYGRPYTFGYLWQKNDTTGAMEPKHTSYKAPNFYIQGSCADVLRICLQSCAKIIEEKALSHKTRICLPIHDELIFNVHPDDFSLVPLFKEAMLRAYKPKHVSFNVAVYVGDNLNDMEEMK